MSWYMSAGQQHVPIVQRQVTRPTACHINSAWPSLINKRIYTFFCHVFWRTCFLCLLNCCSKQQQDAIPHFDIESSWTSKPIKDARIRNPSLHWQQRVSQSKFFLEAKVSAVSYCICYELLWLAAVDWPPGIYTPSPCSSFVVNKGK